MADRIYHPNRELARNAYCSSMEQYRQMYNNSVKNPIKFWSEIANKFYWETPATDDKFFSYNFDMSKGEIFIKWMEGAKTNISFNLLDKNVNDGKGDEIAFHWEGNDPNDHSKISYRKLLAKVCKFANVLRSKGVTKGDRVVIYMPMILELPIAMLACTRIGAIHCVVFAGYSSDALAERILDAKAKILITVNLAKRGEKLLFPKYICDSAMEKVASHGHNVETCIVVSHSTRLTNKRPSLDENGTGSWNSERDCCWHVEMEKVESKCEPVWMDAEDPLFILYTSGSTGKPKGVLHTIAGYMIYAATTFKYVFDYHPGDIYWCTADIGWITGHTYVVYGPLANSATSVLFEGTPFYPENDRYWVIVDKYKVTQFYTSPTAIRSLIKFGDEFVKKHNLSSLKVLGSVGEPINSEAWLWLYNLIGHGKCSIVDTFWQTETGGHVVTPLPGATPMKPGSATFPFFGVLPELLDEDGHVIEGEGEGYLVFRQPWPGMMRSLFENHQRFQSTYFDRFHGYYCTGDGARRDADGYLWVIGRIDDMLNVSGHLMSTAEVESVLTSHSSIAEAAVVSKNHPVKGQCLYCFITPNEGIKFEKKLQDEIKQRVREKIGPFAQPDVIQHAPGLPKTRSGKIMRRILRKIAAGDRNVGDISTLADETIVDLLFQLRPQV
ncbi:acetyl-coenzyme A synthetase-like [Vespa mandarinia]|uniref:acetyl-coenzyme A synthetase-like n=1 Tax=Vespa mandarinia TaxID=7446 RepID=UPI001617FB3E|nr:acetyl-coenzyme A synthetase-like [Vespa mandarinia]